LAVVYAKALKALIAPMVPSTVLLVSIITAKVFGDMILVMTKINALSIPTALLVFQELTVDGVARFASLDHIQARLINRNNALFGFPQQAAM